jgi:DNA-binding SARP family transcriptional activator
VLGPLAVWRGGETVPLGSPRQRAVLGLLALQESREVHRDSIIDTLWPEGPPPSAVTQVQGYLSRLGKLLGDHPIIRIDACYRLDDGTCGLDLTVFRDLIRQARQAASRRDRARACDLYQRALGLWRGDVLADIDLLREHPAAVEVECRRCEAVLGYAEAAASAGYNDRVLPDLRELCAREPLNETAQAHLMLALAAAGQQAAALRVFTNTRDRLSTELGIDPSPVLAGAHIQVLRQVGRLHG